MRPTWSIIVFTVLSGCGLGMAMLMPLVAGAMSKTALFIAAGVAVVLLVAGLLCSTAHLANPKNAWRALFRLRSSWLSREAALALLFFPVFAAWLLAVAAGWGAAPALALATTAVAAATVFCTAMIYASLKPLRLWRHPLTPLNYLSLSALSGALPLAAIAAADAGEPPLAAIVAAALALVAAAAGKAWHFRRADGAGATDVAAAVGLSAARVRLLETGHAAPNFLTREFVYRADPAVVRRCRLLTALGAFLAPFLLIALVIAFPSWHPLLWLASLSALAGLLAERWLFFAEAKHVVRLYHGDDRA